jgi:hypothetical protein
VAQEGMVRIPNDFQNKVKGAVQDLYLKTTRRPAT